METADKYDEWAKAWAVGMRNTAEWAARRRVEQGAAAVHARAAGKERPCGIKGCTRHSYKGRLCRLHYAMVPHEDKMRLTLDCWDAQMTVAPRHRGRFLRELQARLDVG